MLVHGQEMNFKWKFHNFTFISFSALTPTICTSLSDAWSLMKPPPVGILDQMNLSSESPVKLTASIYLPQQSRLVVGRQDGTIIIVPATQTVMLHFLHVNQQNYAGKSTPSPRHTYFSNLNSF